jgi:DNA-binding MarR family transcriptional regulator
MSVKSDPVAQWRDLAAIHASVHAALDRELREHHLSPVEYEVLDMLASAPEARMQDVACGVHLNQSTCSRVVARLEEEGLAERAMCSNDRRGIYAKLTEEGRERLEAAAPTYRRVLAETLQQ